MSLKTCEKCGNSISSKDVKCPHCGNPVKKKSIYLLLGCLIVFFVIVIILEILIYNNASKKPNSVYNNWGDIRYTHVNVNINNQRSKTSKIISTLERNEKVKVDFLKDNWYAVFEPNVKERNESYSIGYVYAPLLYPKPLTKSNSKKSNDSNQILKYTVVEKKDISYLNTPRMVYRIIVNVDNIPSEYLLKNTATHIWRNGNKNWQEFTVFMYLPSMDTESLAYGIGEFRPYGIEEFEIIDYALYGTKWRSEEKEIEKKNKEWEIQKQNNQTQDYFIKLNTIVRNNNNLEIDINTNFPEGTNFYIGVGRTYFEKGNKETYFGKIYGKDIAVRDSKIELSIEVNDRKWYNEYIQKYEQSKGLGIYSGIDQISQNVEVKALFSPRRDQSSNVLKILGVNGEFIKGQNAERTGNFTTFSIQELVNIPFVIDDRKRLCD